MARRSKLPQDAMETTSREGSVQKATKVRQRCRCMWPNAGPVALFEPPRTTDNYVCRHRMRFNLQVSTF